MPPQQEYFIFLTCKRPRVERFNKLPCGYIGFSRPAGTTVEFVFYNMAIKEYITDRIKLYNQDLLLGLPRIPNDSVDVIIADPPYGASTTKKWSYGDHERLKGFGGEWKITNEVWDLLTQNESFIQTFNWLKELKRVIKMTGTIWIHSTYHNSGFVNVCCQLLGLEIINEVVWFKRNSFPNLSGRRLTASHETILWVHKGNEKQRKYYFDYQASKDYHSQSDRIKEQGKQMRTVWDIPNNKSKEEMQFGTHPTQKPIKVAERILKISAPKGGTLLVPFAGSGTEMVAGYSMGLSVIGYEISEDFFNLAAARLKAEVNKQCYSLF